MIRLQWQWMATPDGERWYWFTWGSFPSLEAALQCLVAVRHSWPIFWRCLDRQGRVVWVEGNPAHPPRLWEGEDS